MKRDHRFQFKNIFCETKIADRDKTMCLLVVQSSKFILIKLLLDQDPRIMCCPAKLITCCPTKLITAIEIFTIWIR